MKQITSAQLREMFQQFMESKGHHRIPSASVIPENDPTVLFTTAGMHPLVPYLMGTPHPAGTRLTDVQKCIRTGDIDDVGDPSHLTFFEMLGNWSLGDYFKKEMIPWSWEFLTSEKYLGLDPDKLAFTVFEGDEDCPRDEEAANLWRSCGVKDDHLFYLPKEHNWWGPAGITGPCGPDTEMFIITKKPCGPNCSPACHCGAYLEIWNDVFMQYNKQKDGTFIPLKQKNVDTGMGLERTICVLTGKKTVYETDAFTDILAKIAELSGKEYGADEETTKAFRIIADHMRTSTFILGDDRGVSPSNTDQGYILRRLIRRAVRYGMQLGMPDGFTCEIAKVIINQYKNAYPELERNAAFVIDQLTLEEGRFARTLKQGNKEFDKVASRAADGKIDYLFAPMLVTDKSQLANIDYEFNGIMVRGDCTGDVVFYGKGAGKLPTASAVVADVIDCCKHLKTRKFLYWADGNGKNILPWEESSRAMYVRANGSNVAEKAEKLFGEVTVINKADAPADEKAFVVKAMPYNEFAEKIAQLEADGVSVLSSIRVADL